MLKPIVLYKNRPAIIIAEEKGKFEIETESGFKKVREKDFIILEKNNTENLDVVLSATCSNPNLSELEDFFETCEANLDELIALAWEDLTPKQVWVAWEKLNSSPLLVIENPNAPIKIRTKDEIAEFLKKQNEKEDTEKERDEFVTTLNKCLKQGADGELDIQKYAHFLQEIEALALEKTDKSKILHYAHLKENSESAHRILLKTGFWKIERNPYPTRFGYPLNSSKIKLPEFNLNHNVYDLTNIISYAIDDADSTDPDDAICFDGKYLWIHIANPADIIIPDCDSDLDARKRGATLYLPEGISRMLGEEAVQYFALGLNPVSYALSFKLELDDLAQIISVDILRTKIKVKRLSYKEANDQKECDELKPLFDIAELNRKKRMLAGSIEIEMPEVKITVKTENEVHSVLIEEFNKQASFFMVKEMMLLAGEAAARFAFKNNIPFQYISQESLQISKKLPQGLAGEYRKRKAMRPRSVGSIPAMHSALGISMYSQVTSPLRRYGDLIAHQQLLKFLDGEALMSADDFLMKVTTGDIAARNCFSADKNSKQHWKLIYLLQNPDWQGEAVILETMKKSCRICIPSLAYETEIYLNKDISINETITVRAENIDIPRLEVRFVQV